MNELLIAFGLFLMLEGVCYTLFPKAMLNAIRQMLVMPENYIRIGGFIATLAGFVIIWWMLG